MRFRAGRNENEKDGFVYSRISLSVSFGKLIYILGYLASIFHEVRGEIK